MESNPATDATDAVARLQQTAVRTAHAWFHDNSGWAPPDDDTLADWVADGVCRCPDECLVAPRTWCTHGLASWDLILEDLARHDRTGDAVRGAAAPPDPSAGGPRTLGA